MQRLLPPEEVAEFLGVEVATLYRWRYAGEGPPALRVGKYLRYDPAALKQWLDTRGQKAS
jgi:excisionase family DNA binding protein